MFTKILKINFQIKLFLRFVNVITEPYQDHIFAKPIKAIANKVNIILVLFFKKFTKYLLII
jgi:hypothetical protein